MMILSPRETEILQLIRRHGPLSRGELHQRMGLRPNTVGDLAATMIADGLLRECEGENVGPGRPRQPLEIDGERRRVIGVAFEPGRVSACQLNLHGRRIGGQIERATRTSQDVVVAACTMIRAMGTEGALAVGISATGFVDTDSRAILTSSAMFRQSQTSLDPIYEAAGGCPVLVENDMHAQAAYWSLSQDSEEDKDVLLVDLRDGAIGAALLVNGKPNRGCVMGGNELGHMRFFTDTDVCYCGQTGCLERICSSAFMRRLTGDATADLESRLAAFDAKDEATMQVMRHLAAGIANTINFIRPNRVVLTGRLMEYMTFANQLMDSVREGLLAPLAGRVRMDVWDKPMVSFAEVGAWLALTAIYRGSW
ncbi:MAG TPA: ROK family protein [Tepidisphaeraceae bacterium]|nr:ROK family protein [Tepidisphaeraceae bacterium]